MPGIWWSHSPNYSTQCFCYHQHPSDFTFLICSSCSLSLWYFLDKFLGFLSDVTVSWDCHVYHSCSLLLLVNHHVRFVRQQLLVCLEVEFPQDLSPVVLNNFWRCLPSGLRDFRFTHGTYAPVLGLPSKTTDSVQQRWRRVEWCGVSGVICDMKSERKGLKDGILETEALNTA